MIKAVLFDLDGTLLDRDTSLRRFIDSQYERLDLSSLSIQKKEYVNRFIELDNNGYVWKDKVYQQLVREMQINHISWEELLHDYITFFKNHVVPFHHLYDMLEELKKKNLLLGIITNGKGNFQLDNIHALRIFQYFQVIVVSEFEGMKKPQSQIFLHALKKINISPKESVFIGDHFVNDVEASEKAGMIGIWKKNDQWNNMNTQYIIDDLIEIPTIINKINGTI
ncbi:HAD family hydrolase [Evansella sp. AB-P1]|uniref:HAD family hydrolase n=1 Tax=Evansella sp. AB-P1 TaxID=3037653 RepID=UPI00241E4051|nr:HAD family hydrolase [Evansella sp. AB-P1]MDG5788578.1 HAD family hydrolase [Evansella sp. AB-P1]